MKILIRTPLNPHTGYGNDGIGMARALMRWGADVYVTPMGVESPLPPEVAMLLTKRLEGPFDLGIIHTDPACMEALPAMRAACDVVVGWTMWEYTNFDNLHGVRSTMRKRLAQFDAMLAYDEVTKKALSDYTKTPIGIVQGGYDADDWKPVVRDWHAETFKFCMVGALHDRKDPFVSIQAFKELKEELGDDFNAELHLKTLVRTLHPKMEEWIPGLKIHYAAWSREQLEYFYSQMHVLLAPSRGEGKNMPALEFMSTGGTVIATAWGGHTQWLSDAYAYPLRYDLRPVDSKHPNCLNARADKDHLKELMLRAYRDRSECREKAEIAERSIPSMCSWDSVMHRLFNRVAEVVPDRRGHAVRNQAIACRVDERPRQAVGM